MKINNKGFAITSIIYSMLILFLTLVVLIISNLASRKVVFDQQKEDILDNLSKTYIKGDIVYFNVKDGNVCTESEYKMSYDSNKNDYLNSATDYNGITKTSDLQNGCLKFYVLNNDNSETITLLLDHNTTSKVHWNNFSLPTNVNGPSSELAGDLLYELKEDTKEWKGTETPENYIFSSSGPAYEIKYDKARLITAEEVAQITGKTEWGQTSANEEYYFYSLDLNSEGTGEFCKTNGCQYNWLYDRTRSNCKDYGCLNNEFSATSDDGTDIYGYWTSTANVSYEIAAWRVFFLGGLDSIYIVNDGKMTDKGDYYNAGVRPVIIVKKNKL